MSTAGAPRGAGPVGAPARRRRAAEVDAPPRGRQPGGGPHDGSAADRPPETEDDHGAPDSRSGGLPRRAWLPRADPAGKLMAAVLVTAGLIPVVDPVTSGIVLAAGLALLPFAGLDRARMLALGGPLVLMGASIGFVNLVFGEEGPVAALGAAVRLLAIALPSLLAAVTSDPTDMADSLVQRLRMPERPAIAVLAALRLVPLLFEQWRTLGRARRARGLDAGGNPARAAAIFAGKAFALLVRSIRTGILLAMAMDARGFAGGPRSHARLSAWRARDTALVASAAAVLGGAHAVSAAVGTWAPLTF
ncbi:energy-coupling factor transporter transmembrane component T family protein [Streptomonospora wellingtoniae]|uniref:Energy-coupling factor transporter transmembrane component T n=1 Tax=Streptomonospora wellingtoniae TaxID=3075544 RepID=A0ABU2KSX0_9ACTN|nr:energy-coupling factor transporter transmembrane component T [Streptomonospora sp. DSM 45055]MDT0302384.1 energy-coupling factor transporter transmembrane component T [Streptomonospora sp. DSM 45055]